MIKLIGIAVVAAGFALRLNPLLVVVAAGVENMTRVPMGASVIKDSYPFGPEMQGRYPNLVPQGISAELIAEKWGISRDDMDRFGLQSQERAARATREGRFQAEILPVLDAEGKLVGLHLRVSGQSILTSVRPEALVNGMDPAVFQGMAPSGEFEFGYGAIPNLLIDHAMRNPHVPPGFWRGVNINQNAVYIESFIDELALASGQDPLEFRRKLLAKEPRMLGVLNLAAEKAGWGKKLPAGRAMGVALMEGYGTYMAQIAEVSVNRSTGQIKVHNFWCTIDCGVAVQPDNIIAQTEGSTVYGLGMTLSERITIKNGAVEQSNFYDYALPRMNEVPAMHVELIQTDNHPTGAGQMSTPLVAPAVSNAVFALTGVRLRHTPFTPDRVKKALA